MQNEVLIDTGTDIITITKTVFGKFLRYGNYIETNEKITNFDGS